MQILKKVVIENKILSTISFLTIILGAGILIESYGSEKFDSFLLRFLFIVGAIVVKYYREYQYYNMIENDKTKESQKLKRIVPMKNAYSNDSLEEVVEFFTVTNNFGNEIEKIKSMIIPFLQITTTKLEKDIDCTISKFGGCPYIPKNGEWPKDTEGNKKTFLAQINFSEIHAIKGEHENKLLPEKGLLQFFIRNNDVAGLGEKNGYHIARYNHIEKDNKEHEENTGGIPFSDRNQCYKIDFSYKYELPYHESIEHRAMIEEVESMEFEEFIENTLETNLFGTECGHKLLGYSKFSQDDPRKEDSEYILLFQFDSENIGGERELLRGDCGTAQFFIKRNDLLKRDFSKILYNRDCY